MAKGFYTPHPLDTTFSWNTRSSGEGTTSRSLYALDVTGSQINSYFPVVCGDRCKYTHPLPVQNEKKTHPPASVAVGGGVCVADKHPASRHGILTMFPFGAGVLSCCQNNTAPNLPSLRSPLRTDSPTAQYTFCGTVLLFGRFGFNESTCYYTQDSHYCRLHRHSHEGFCVGNTFAYLLERIWYCSNSRV